MTAFVPPARRAALGAIFALDDRLAAIVRTTREPILGQMRLTWWREALIALDDGPAPAEPVLLALAAAGPPGAMLARIVDGWEALLASDPLTNDALAAFAGARGGGLFAAAAHVLDAAAGDPVAATGAAWALLDLAGHTRDAALAARARASAAIPAGRWSGNGRPLGMLALLAQDALVDRTTDRLRAIVRLLRLRLTGQAR